MVEKETLLIPLWFISINSEDVVANLAPDVEYRIREIIQESLKFVRHSRRTNLTTQDINSALKVKNVEVRSWFYNDLK